MSIEAGCDLKKKREKKDLWLSSVRGEQLRVFAGPGRVSFLQRFASAAVVAEQPQFTFPGRFVKMERIRKYMLSNHFAKTNLSVYVRLRNSNSVQ